MKKLLFILFMLSCLVSNSQTMSIYKKLPKYDCILFHGLHSEYLDLLTLFQQPDSSIYRYNYSNNTIWVGYVGAAIYPGTYACTDGVNFDYLDSTTISTYYVSNQVDIFPPYVNNYNGYSRMVDTLGGAGNGKIMPTAAAQSSIASINTSLSNKADKSTTLTINGISLSLSANRSWTVGDVLTGGSYSNPSWINSLAYSKLTGTPSIPAAQVNSDWNSVSGVSQILNKPTLKRVENYKSTTDGSGNYTVTFGTAYSSIPHIQANLIGNETNQYIRIVSVSTTGFTVNAYSFVTNNVLGIINLTTSTTALSGATVDVLINE